MKPRLKILSTGILILVIIYSAFYVFAIFKSKAIIIERLKAFTERDVSLGYFDFAPPLNFKIKNLNIEGLAKIDEVFISVSIPYLLTGNIALNNVMVVRPEITFVKVQPKAAEPSAAPVPIPTTEPILGHSLKSEGKSPFLRLIVKRLNIKDGKVDFIDPAAGPEGIKIIVKDINFNLSNLYTFPFSAITNFELKGRIPWRAGGQEGKIGAEGWMNFFKKDMQATLKIEDIDGIYLYPYYSQWVDLEKARIESAKLNFTSNINGLNNNVTAECHIELTDIVRKRRPPKESPEKAEKIADAILDIFKSSDQGRVILNFTIRTKMDSPELGFSNIKTAVEHKLAQMRSAGGIKTDTILMLPFKLIEGVVKGATDVSRAMIDGTFAVGNELKSAVEDSFRKEPK
jgi:hypothetical protein